MRRADVEVDLRRHALESPDELAEIDALERGRYTTAAWVGQEPATPDAMGSATLKTEGGLLSAHLTLAGDVLKAVYLTGDFFCDEAVVAGLERALRWHPSHPDAVATTLEALRERDGLAIPRVPADALARVIGMAVEGARRNVQGAQGKGCFVNP